MHYLITGHTGFKGAWLILLLTEAGHTVSGLSLDPEPGCLFERASLAERMTWDFRSDIRDATATTTALQQASPDVVIHMAAQPLVRESYREPRLTIETNVNGTFNVLEAVGATESVKAHLVVTTDKVYRNVNRVEGYREDEPLGGDDPYSVSKAMADLLVHSWTHSFAGPPTALARAGNVIGGGDTSKERLLPDIMRSFASGKAVEIRYPNAVRPWQHVLDCLHGYLMLVDALLASSDAVSDHGAWNFGPEPASFATVADVAARTATLWGPTAAITLNTDPQPHEAGLLTLDSTKAREILGWRDLLSLDEALAWTVDWEKSVASGRSAIDISIDQIAVFVGMGRPSNSRRAP